MPLPEMIESMFSDGRVTDVHVNVGRKSHDGYIDGDLGEKHIRRQFSIEGLKEENLVRMGLRTHYSRVDIPEGFEKKFTPSVTINWIGVNPERVEQEIRRFSHPHPIVWFQSFRDPYHSLVADAGYKRVVGLVGEEMLTITHTDEFGRLSKETLGVLEVARDSGAVIATPHSNWERTVPLIVKAVELGLSVLWVHPDSRLIETPLGVQQALAEWGQGRIFIERAAVFLRDGKPGYYSAQRIVSDIRAIGKEYIVFSSDLGRYKPEDPLRPYDGLRWYISQLISSGLTIEEAEMGLVINPSWLLKE